MNLARRIADRLTPAFRRSNAASGPTNRRLVKIGDGLGNPQPATLLSPREVYYRSSSNANDRGVAVLGPDILIPIQGIEGYYDVSCWIENIPGSTQPVINEIADIPGFTTGDATPMETLANIAAFPDLSRIVWFRIRPPVGGGMAVCIDVGPYAVKYTDANGLTKWFRSMDFGFPDPTDGSIFVPAAPALAPGQHRIYGIGFDRSAAVMHVIAGASVSTTSTLPSSDSRTEFAENDDAFSAISFSSYFPCGYVYNYYGQTDVVEDDIFREHDPRQLMQPAGSVSMGVLLTDAFGDVLSDAFGDPLWEP